MMPRIQRPQPQKSLKIGTATAPMAARVVVTAGVGKSIKRSALGRNGRGGRLYCSPYHTGFSQSLSTLDRPRADNYRRLPLRPPPRLVALRTAPVIDPRRYLKPMTPTTITSDRVNNGKNAENRLPASVVEDEIIVETDGKENHIKMCSV